MRFIAEDTDGYDVYDALTSRKWEEAYTSSSSSIIYLSLLGIVLSVPLLVQVMTLIHSIGKNNALFLPKHIRTS